ncbi:OLC1v1030380C1 [Oldenlandia corymbosa var. corymbosa]|uniref:OLC1v1030380C1 n=1 Tax=Oldenlandia corymbosa var. corymbosa TaxID=529605 RepID=A0AAV1CJ94_OLDCO|nr:OLC1v1030380C1 [Oldenlandia corymbosa var. corymbosa]
MMKLSTASQVFLVFLLLFNICAIKLVATAQSDFRFQSIDGDEYANNFDPMQIDDNDFDNKNNNEQCKAWLVQSIPTDMPQLPRVPGVLSTADVFRWLAGNSSKSLDIIAQYWQLVAHPNDPRSGDYGYSEDEMQKFGANEGFEVYRALEDAADRNITIRFLQHSGVYPDFTEEPSKLASGRPNVKNVTLLLGDWWGSGIVHAKVWISDDQDVYIGSANNDWKSLTQVKELGIYLVGCPAIARKVTMYFSNLWKLAHLNSSSCTKFAFDELWQVTRKVPCWSHFHHPKERCRTPLQDTVKTPHVAGYPPLSDPSIFHVSIETPAFPDSALEPESSYLSFAPPELSFGKCLTDEQAWVDTIKSVGEHSTLRISTMDWLGQSQYTTEKIYWSSLSSAVSEVISYYFITNFSGFVDAS